MLAGRGEGLAGSSECGAVASCKKGASQSEVLVRS